ncbi:MAG: hypothetical protein OEL79_08875 [Chromatiales bacterium]|nr:hypothetical protein [Chromatiales bacterium]
MKITKVITYTVFCLAFIICGCSKTNQQPSNEPSMPELLKVLGINWWNVSLPGNFDPSTNSYDSLQFVIQDTEGNIIKKSGAWSATNMGKSIKAFVRNKRSDSEMMDLSIIYEKGTFNSGISTMRSLNLENINTRLSGENINVGDVLIKGRTENFTYDTYNHSADWNTIQKGEVGLVLRIKKDDE